MPNMRTCFLLIILLLCSCATNETRDDPLAISTTEELRLRHAQLTEALSLDTKQPDLEFMKPVWERGPSRKDRTAERERIERELLKRWQNGDQKAELPIFHR